MSGQQRKTLGKARRPQPGAHLSGAKKQASEMSGALHDENANPNSPSSPMIQSGKDINKAPNSSLFGPFVSPYSSQIDPKFTASAAPGVSSPRPAKGVKKGQQGSAGPSPHVDKPTKAIQHDKATFFESKHQMTGPTKLSNSPHQLSHLENLDDSMPELLLAKTPDRPTHVPLPLSASPAGHPTPRPLQHLPDQAFTLAEMVKKVPEKAIISGSPLAPTSKPSAEDDDVYDEGAEQAPSDDQVHGSAGEMSDDAQEAAFSDDQDSDNEQDEFNTAHEVQPPTYINPYESDELSRGYGYPFVGASGGLGYGLRPAPLPPGLRHWATVDMRQHDIGVTRLAPHHYTMGDEFGALAPRSPELTEKLPRSKKPTASGSAADDLTLDRTVSSLFHAYLENQGKEATGDQKAENDVSTWPFAKRNNATDIPDDEECRRQISGIVENVKNTKALEGRGWGGEQRYLAARGLCWPHKSSEWDILAETQKREMTLEEVEGGMSQLKMSPQLPKFSCSYFFFYGRLTSATHLCIVAQLDEHPRTEEEFPVDENKEDDPNCPRTYDNSEHEWEEAYAKNWNPRITKVTESMKPAKDLGVGYWPCPGVPLNDYVEDDDDEPLELVKGMLWRATSLRQIALLEQFEGTPYKLRFVDVTTKGGRQLKCRAFVQAHPDKEDKALLNALMLVADQFITEAPTNDEGEESRSEDVTGEESGAKWLWDNTAEEMYDPSIDWHYDL